MRKADYLVNMTKRTKRAMVKQILQEIIEEDSRKKEYPFNIINSNIDGETSDVTEAKKLIKINNKKEYS